MFDMANLLTVGFDALLACLRFHLGSTNLQVSERSQGLGQAVNALQGHHCAITGE